MGTGSSDLPSFLSTPGGINVCGRTFPFTENNSQMIAPIGLQRWQVFIEQNEDLAPALSCFSEALASLMLNTSAVRSRVCMVQTNDGRSMAEEGYPGMTSQRRGT